jgi:starvation-inducible DNA-binding protein
MRSFRRDEEAVRKGIDEADRAGDKDTTDRFTEISRGTDQWLWFVEAHLQADA